MSGGFKRNLFHVTGGLSIPVAALFLPREILLLALGTIVFIVLGFEFLRFKAPAVNKWFFRNLGLLARETETLRLTGASYMLIGGLAAFLVFQRDIAVLAVSFMA